MFRKVLSFIIITVFLFNLKTTASAESLSAESYILYHPLTNEIILQKNIDKQLTMASTTKILTGLIACSQYDMGKILTVKSEMIKVEGTSVGLKAGDKISLLELCYGMMLESGNDAANCIAYAISGSLSEFAKLMNKTALEIGMTNSNFVTPSGLDADGHYTTAYDMAILTSAALQNETFREIVSAKTHKAVYNNGNSYRTYSNHNRLLSSLDGCIGVKTGFTKKSGRCLVSACKRNGVELVAVTLNAPNDWSDHARMYEIGYSNLKTISYNQNLLPEKMHICGGDKAEISIKTEPFEIFVPNSVDTQITAQIALPQFLYAPVEISDTVGTIEYYLNDKKIAEIPFTATEKSAIIVEKQKFIDVFIKNFLHLIKI